MTKEEKEKIARFVVKAITQAQQALAIEIEKAFSELIDEDTLNNAWEEKFQTEG